MGITDRPLVPLLQANAATRFEKKPGRMEFHRGVLEEIALGSYRVAGTGRQGSGILRSMSQANGLVVLPDACGPIEPGESAMVLPLAAVI